MYGSGFGQHPSRMPPIGNWVKRSRNTLLGNRLRLYHKYDAIAFPVTIVAGCRVYPGLNGVRTLGVECVRECRKYHVVGDARAV